MWYAKMYFSGEREFFENDAFGMQGLPSKQLELPFLESLLTFLELDEKEITPMLERISVNWERFVESRDHEAYTAAMVELGVLAEKHIYLRLLYTRSFGCFSVNGYDQAEIQAIALDLKEFAKQFSETRKQVEKFLECVLDVDSAGREPQKQAAKNYHHDQPRDPELFRFEPIPLSFEPVEPGRCAPVLYSSRRAGYDRLFAAKLRRARRDRAPLQELRPLVSADRACERRVLRAPREVRRAALPRDRRVPAVDEKADRRSHFQGVPQGV